MTDRERELFFRFFGGNRRSAQITFPPVSESKEEGPRPSTAVSPYLAYNPSLVTVIDRSPVSSLGPVT